MRARRSSHSTPGRMAAATITPRKTSAITTLIFHRTSAATTIPRTTRVATATRRAVVPMTRDCCPLVERGNPMVTHSGAGSAGGGAAATRREDRHALGTPGEIVLVDERRHGIV